MKLPNNAEELQELFYKKGFEVSGTNDQYVESTIKNSILCPIIARNGKFIIIYVEGKSDWRRVVTDLLKKSINMCLVATHIGQNHYVFSTLTTKNGINKPTHIVINNQTKRQLVSDFISGMHISSNTIDVKTSIIIQKAFAKFDRYTDAINEFAENLHDVIQQMRQVIEEKGMKNLMFQNDRKKFLKMCKNVINEQIESDDVTEMLIQHILTYRIFSLIYDQNEFHKTNSVAKNLAHLVNLLKIDMSCMKINYSTIELVAESVTENHERQELLKKVYETFYAKYNPKKAETQGIVYTPFEVVDFMIKSTDILLRRHFGYSLSKKNVKILDPATGTGTFITHLLEYIDEESLDMKYKNDIIANDVSILPYYIAALNIEHTFKERTGMNQEFENICWMDTLETDTKNLEKLHKWFGNLDNIKRIEKQRSMPICVVIGNPPYNAVQSSYNNNNASGEFPKVDKRIKETYVKNSKSGNKDKQYDMYKRFLRWATDCIGKNGIVAFVSNNSFLEATSDDGLRTVVAKEFEHIYIINLKGNAWTSGEERKKQKGNIFDDKIKVGISISFFLKTGEKNENDNGKIHYAEIGDYLKSNEKKHWLAENTIETIQMQDIVPDKKNIWLNQTNNNFDCLVPIYSKTGNAIFNELSLGCSSGRDDWVYDFNEFNLKTKIKYFLKSCNTIIKDCANGKIVIETINNKTNINYLNNYKKNYQSIKLTRDLLKRLRVSKKQRYAKNKTLKTLYRPFLYKNIYFDNIVIDWTRKFEYIFKNSNNNKLIAFSNPNPKKSFVSLASNKIMELHCIGDTQCIPRYMYNKDNKQQSNINKWGLELFQEHYKKKIKDDDIFYYVYAIFNDPKYVKKYKFDLQRSFPRIPLTKNFDDWKIIGKKLYNLHTGFESAEEYPLKTVIKKYKKNKTKLQLKKMNDGDLYKIFIDENTILEEIPKEATEYMFSSKCALEWILEYYKENKNTISDKSSDDSIIIDKFNTYNFGNHKKYVMSLLKKIVTVSIETVKLRNQLKDMPYGPQLEFKSKVQKMKTENKITTIKIKRKRRKKIKISKLQFTLEGEGQSTLN